MEKAYKLSFETESNEELVVANCGCSKTEPLHSFGPALKPNYVIHFVLNGKGKFSIIGQYAENVYFGKPCGLMDQMACSVGNLVHIDFADKANPIIDPVSFDFAKYGYSLCITDTKGSHADLTHEYAAVPAEMRAAAAVLGKEVLHGTSIADLLNNADEIREKAGDRAFLRAIHFVTENVRVQNAVAALRAKDFDGFLKMIKASGDSSYKYLQNVYTNQDVVHQNVSVALLNILV